MSINIRNYDKNDIEFKNKVKMAKLSAHCNITNPEKMGYPYLESIRSFANLCDEVIVVDGGSTDGSLKKIEEIPKVKITKGKKWERNFVWTVMAENLNIGYKACSYEWAFHFDVDYIFHEDYVKQLRETLVETDLPAIELKKTNFVLVNENFRKDHYPFLVHKTRYPIICYGIGTYGDRKESARRPSLSFLRPIVGKSVGKDGIPRGDIIRMSIVRLQRENIPLYTYDFTFMTKAQVKEQKQRFHNSLKTFRGGKERAGKESVFKIFIGMMKSRHKKCQKEGTINIGLEEHSKFIREKVKNIKPEQFGYNAWGLL